MALFFSAALLLFSRADGFVGEVGIDPRPGSPVPGELVLTDEHGRPFRLEEAFGRPVVLSLVYYRCPGICQALLSGVQEVLLGLSLVPGEDYRVVTVSFDPGDRPEDSRRTRENYLAGMGRTFPEDAWVFLTGDSAAIAELTEAVGFHYRRVGEHFVHPTALVVLSPKGRISRYLYGTTYLPADLELAIREAQREKWGTAVAKVLRFCFPYDPESRRFVVSLTRVVGGAVLLVAGLFGGYLVVTSRRHRCRLEGGPPEGRAEEEA
jgi:protein SCO1/2